MGADTRADKVSELYRVYGAVIYARCCRLLTDRTAAEDATQETFVRVHRHLAKAPSGEEALRWIYRIATNYCLNEIRNRKNRPQSVEHLPNEQAISSPEQRLVDQDLARRLIEQAPERLRSTAWFFHVDGMEQDEIARILGVSRRTVVYDLAAFAERARKLSGQGAA